MMFWRLSDHDDTSLERKRLPFRILCLFDSIWILCCCFMMLFPPQSLVAQFVVQFILSLAVQSWFLVPALAVMFLNSALLLMLLLLQDNIPLEEVFERHGLQRLQIFGPNKIERRTMSPCGHGGCSQLRGKFCLIFWTIFFVCCLLHIKTYSPGLAGCIYYKAITVGMQPDIKMLMEIKLIFLNGNWKFDRSIYGSSVYICTLWVSWATLSLLRES
jgi:hypothetical protein